MTNGYTTFYIARHGETEWNVLKKMQGHSDIPLNKVGITQAQELAKLFKGITFADVFSSDLLRAKRTAEVIAAEKNLVIKTTTALREKKYGKFEGKPWDEVREAYKKWGKISDEEKWTFRADESEENNEQAVSRFITFLRESAVANFGKNVLIVSHGGLMRILLIKLGYGTWEKVGSFDNCGYIRLESDGVDFTIKEVTGLKEWRK